VDEGVDETDGPAGVDIPVYTCVIPEMLKVHEVESTHRQLRARSGHRVCFDSAHGKDVTGKKGYIHFLACAYDSFGAEYAVKMVPKADAADSAWRYESESE
jgi:hypothetical protein